MYNNEHFFRPKDLLKFDSSTYVNVNLIITSSLLFTAQHTNIINNLEQISIQGVNIPEIPYTSDQLLDSPENVGKYFCLNDNCITFVVDKERIKTIQDAKNYIFGIYAEYQMKVLSYNTAEAVYIMTTRTSSGQEVNINTGSSLPTLMNKINILDENLEINNQLGFNIHEITRLIQ